MQIAEYDGGRRKIVAHVGSARTEAELGILIERAREMLADPAQGAFDLGIEPVGLGNTIRGGDLRAVRQRRSTRG